MKAMVIIQLLVAFGLLNVWLLRARSKTAFRGGDSLTLGEEFRAYGLPKWAFRLVGTLKLTAAALLISGIWLPALVVPAAAVVSVLMLAALAMHLKIKDPLIKSIPAITMLLMNVAVLYLMMNSAA